MAAICLLLSVYIFNKVSCGGLVMTYDESTGLFTVDSEDYLNSKKAIPYLPEWVKGTTIGRSEYFHMIEHVSNQQ